MRINAKRHSNEKDYLASLPKELIEEPTCRIVVVKDYVSPHEVLAALIDSVIRLAVKYRKGVLYIREFGDPTFDGKVKLLAPAKQGSPINAATQINGDLFVNALLVEVFAKAGLENLMLDKYGRPYAAQLIGKVYNRMFQLQTITGTRVLQLKNIMKVFNEDFISKHDATFAKDMGNTLIPNYLSRLENSKFPGYSRKGLVQEFRMVASSLLMKYLANTVQIILGPNENEQVVSLAMARATAKMVISRIQIKMQKKSGKSGVESEKPIEAAPVDLAQEKDEDVPPELLKDLPRPGDDAVEAVAEERKEDTPPKKPLTTKINLFSDDDDDDAVTLTGMPMAKMPDDDPDTFSRTISFHKPEPRSVVASPSANGAATGTTSGTEKTRSSWFGKQVNELPPGKAMIDRIMALLVQKEDHLELDDFNRIRMWAATHVEDLLRDRLNDLQGRAEKLNDELDQIRKNYYA